MIKLGVIYGGMSTEHEVSKVSAKSVIQNLDKSKYDIYPIYIDKSGCWHDKLNDKAIENIIEFLKKLDIVFPVLHGLYGEDGTIQGMLKMSNIKYVGCGILSSSIGMDKAYTKIIFEKAKINQAKYIYVKKYEDNKYILVDENFDEKTIDINELIEIAESKLKYPIFVKPSNSGSSVGVNKSVDDKQLKENIECAFKYDNKILIEQGVKGKEVECAVLGNCYSNIEITDPGEIIPAEDYYSFDAKYENKESKVLIPANITEEQKQKIKELAKKAFLAIDGSGLSRVDFFIEEGTGKIYINEINTMPGFTEISMYPKLFEYQGYTYSELLDKIIMLAN